jgi:hypothetical protein
MGDTLLLLSKIAELRQRLGQALPLAANAASPACLLGEANDAPSRVTQLEDHVRAGAEHHALLDTSLRQLARVGGNAPGEVVWPERLTVRGRRLLERGRELISRLRGLTEEPLLRRDAADPLDVRFRETVAMTDTALRMIQAFPDAPSAQLRLCEGIEAILDVVDARLEGLLAVIDQRRREAGWITTLANLLGSLAAGNLEPPQAFVALGEELLAEAGRGAPLRFLHAHAQQPAQFIACHSLIVAQVVARVVRYDPDLRHRALDAVLAALVHDVGMLGVPVEILAQPGPLSDEQRRIIEGHTRSGAEAAVRLWPEAGWLADAVAGHHERLDGTGYPNGLRDTQIAPLNRLLAVCDVYAALCAPRPHRLASETRTALTDTLLLAEQGLLDRYQAERLLTLSFYPVGSVVELADGAVGVIVATHLSGRELNNPARPVLTLLTDSQGQLLPSPQYLDLAQVEGRSIIRTLSLAERRQILGKRYPEAA